MDEMTENLALETPTARPEIMQQGIQAKDALDGLLTEDRFGPPRARQAFKDYVRMGKGRTLKELATVYLRPEHPEWSNDAFESIFRRLKEYSRLYKWQDNLRLFIIRAGAEVLAEAQKDALIHAKVRIKIAQEAQRAGRTILEKAQLDKLSTEEARKLLGEGTKLIQVGTTAERAEQGDVLATIRPDKPIEEMTPDELDEYSRVLQKAIQ